VTRRGAPEGAYLAAGHNDSRHDTAIAEVALRVRAALRLQAHGMASGEIRSNDLSEAVMRHLSNAEDWLDIAGARDA
jgi:hypothetical protein